MEKYFDKRLILSFLTYWCQFPMCCSCWPERRPPTIRPSRCRKQRRSGIPPADPPPQDCRKESISRAYGPDGRELHISRPVSVRDKTDRLYCGPEHGLWQDPTNRFRCPFPTGRRSSNRLRIKCGEPAVLYSLSAKEDRPHVFIGYGLSLIHI